MEPPHILCQPPTTIDDLPPEILDQIVALLPASSLRPARAVNHRFQSILAPYVFRSVRVPGHNGRLDHFVHIARSPHLAPLVREVVCNTGPLPRIPRPFGGRGGIGGIGGNGDDLETMDAWRLAPALANLSLLRHLENVVVRCEQPPPPPNEAVPGLADCFFQLGRAQMFHLLVFRCLTDTWSSDALGESLQRLRSFRIPLPPVYPQQWANVDDMAEHHPTGEVVQAILNGAPLAPDFDTLPCDRDWELVVLYAKVSRGEMASPAMVPIENLVLTDPEPAQPLSVKCLTMPRLAYFTGPWLTETAVFKALLGSVEELRFCLSDVDWSHPLTGDRAAYRVRFRPQLSDCNLYTSAVQTWVAPSLATNLRRLTLHCNDYVDWLNGRDLRGADLSRVRALTLGKYPFLNSWQMTWLAALDLEELVLDDAVVVEVTQPVAKTASLEWSTLLDCWREHMHRLRVFRMGVDEGYAVKFGAAPTPERPRTGLVEVPEFQMGYLQWNGDDLWSKPAANSTASGHQGAVSETAEQVAKRRAVRARDMKSLQRLQSALQTRLSMNLAPRSASVE